MNWVIVGAIGAATYLFRLSFIAILGRTGIPHALVRPLRYVAPSVFAAILALGIFVGEEGVDLRASNLTIYAALAAGVVAWKTKSIGATIVVGLVALNVLDYLT